MEEELVTSRRRASVAAVLSASALLLAIVPSTFAQESPAPAGPPPKLVGAFATKITEPWDGVINAALEAAEAEGRIDYSYQDDIGYDGQMEPVLRGMVADGATVIFGDAFGNGEAVRTVAAESPDVAFVFGSDGGPAEPNLSVFDNWIHEPAYLAGMLAGGLTKSNIIGVVGAMPIPEVNRLVNAYIAGAQYANPEVAVKVSFINSFDDLATAHEAALAQIGAGADVLYAERDGVIAAAKEKGVLAIGNMSDQQAQAPENVITSVVWDMQPTVDYVLDQVAGGTYAAQDLGGFSSYAKGGATLAAINEAIAGGVPPELVAKVAEREAQIKSGEFRVDVNEGAPTDVAGGPAPSPAS